MNRAISLALVGLVIALPRWASARVPDPPEPRQPKLSLWQSSRATPFASVATDLGFIYFRPRMTLGYGAPFWSFVGLDAYWMTTNSFTAPYLGWRASLPFLDAMIGARRTIPFNRRFLPKSDSHLGDDIELREGDIRSAYNAIDFEVAGYAPIAHGTLFLSVHPVWVDAPNDVQLYEEVLRAVIDPPFALGLRSGWLYGFGEQQALKVGGMLEYVALPGRPAGVWRSGPVVLMTFSKTLEGLFAFSVVLSSPDELGIFHGTYAFLGILHRFARRF